MTDLTPFQELMMCVFVCQRGYDSEYTLQKLVNILSDPTVDFTQEDNQLFRELHVGRLNTQNSLAVYKTLVEKRNYIMTAKDLSQLLFHFSSA